MKWIVENTTTGQWRMFYSETDAQKVYERWCKQIGDGYITIREI